MIWPLQNEGGKKNTNRIILKYTAILKSYESCSANTALHAYVAKADFCPGTFAHLATSLHLLNDR